MIVQNSYVYIQIGLSIRLLRNVNASTEAWLPQTEIQSLTRNLHNGNFQVTLAAMSSTNYSEMESSINAMERSQAITKELAGSIEEEFEKIENIIFAEALTKKIYILAQRRFNTEYLLSEPEKLLKEGAFAKLDEIARTDFSSSCRCILFGEPTASAFHILRATESVLKSYYAHHRRQNRLPKPMWGSMVDQLKMKTRNKPPAALIASLDLIRTAYRNPTQHPEAVYEIDSAQDLFGVCLDVIGKMTDEL